MTADHRFSSGLRSEARRQIENLGQADLIVGIPSY